jgi:TnsA endonuclease N terminal
MRALERDFVTLASFMDADALVTAQPVTIRFAHEGRQRRYTPDFRVDWSDGRCEIIEIKYRADLRTGWIRFRPAFAAARHWARSNGAHFRIATERGIRGRQLDAAKRLLPLRSASVDTALAERAVAHARDNAVSFGALVDALPASHEAGLAVVWRLIARGALVVDLAMPITPETRVTAP